MIATPAGPVLIDTDILIDFLRGGEDAVAFLEGLQAPLLVSAITVAELFVGARDDKDERRLRAFLAAFEVIPVDDHVATVGGRLRGRFGPSHGTGLADALIAASAQATGARLATRNRRHFPMFEDVLVPY